jgi:hypothetical protein
MTFARLQAVFNSRYGLVLAAVLAVLTVQDAQAVPSMARQTGLQCAACHTVFPALTPFGRQFKLRGYSASAGKNVEGSMFGGVPISIGLQGSRNATQTTDTPGSSEADFPRDREWIVQQLAGYYGGRITEKSGALVQYNYDGIERKWAMEMFDVRYADATTSFGGKELVYGLTVNNNPTVTDLYNSTPQWVFPHAESVAVMPSARTLVDMTLAGQVGGPSVYAMWDGLLYGEVGLYRTASRGLFRPLGWGVEQENVVRNFAPYWRLALQREVAPHSFMIGTYGLSARVYPEHDDRTTPTNRFTDIAFDGQYQYISDRHILSVTGTWIRERRKWEASFPAGEAASESATLRTLRADAHYWFNRKYGGGVQWFNTSGDADPLVFASGTPVYGSANGRPDSRGWMGELNYLPWQNVKLALRYTAYSRFNGSSSDYDGFGRKASDNNSVFLIGWVLW